MNGASSSEDQVIVVAGGAGQGKRAVMQHVLEDTKLEHDRLGKGFFIRDEVVGWKAYSRILAVAPHTRELGGGS